MRSRSTSLGSIEGAVAGDEDRRLGAELDGAGEPEAGGLGVAALLGVLDDLGMDGAGHLLGARLGADEDRPLDHPRLREGGEDVAGHRGDEVAAAAPGHAGAEALLGGGEALDGEDRDGLHRAASSPAKSSTASATVRRPSASAIRVGVLSTSMPAGGSSGSSESTTIAEITPA